MVPRTAGYLTDKLVEALLVELAAHRTDADVAGLSLLETRVELLLQTEDVEARRRRARHLNATIVRCWTWSKKKAMDFLACWSDEAEDVPAVARRDPLRATPWAAGSS